MKILQEIPFKIKWKIFFSGKLMYLAFLVLIPATMLIVFAPNVDYADNEYEEHSTIETKEVLTSVTETNMSVNGDAALKYCFGFYHEDELEQGHSYGFDTNYSVGDTVSVEYLSNDFRVSRIVGTKDAPFTFDTLGMIINPLLVGLALLIFTIYRKIKLINVLKSGFKIIPTVLQRELKTPTLPVGKANPFYRFKFAYNVSGTTYNKLLYISTDEYSAVRIRKSHVIIDEYNHTKSIVLEALPFDVRDYIINKNMISNRN